MAEDRPYTYVDQKERALLEAMGETEQAAAQTAGLGVLAAADKVLLPPKEAAAAAELGNVAMEGQVLAEEEEQDGWDVGQGLREVPLPLVAIVVQVTCPLKNNANKN